MRDVGDKKTDQGFPNLILANLPPELPASRLPRRLRVHGPKVIQYAYALNWLAKAGFAEARQANLRLRKGNGSKPQASAAVDLDKIARWSVDEFSLVALQLILFLDSARLNPSSYGRIGLVIHGLKLREFDVNTCSQWWRLAKATLPNAQLESEALAGLALLMPPSAVRSIPEQRKFFLRRLKQRFYAFAPTPEQYRGLSK